MSTYFNFCVETKLPTHSVFVEGTKVSCDYLPCNYEEEFDTIEDAETAASIHEEEME